MFTWIYLNLHGLGGVGSETDSLIWSLKYYNKT